jgi:hypothetical protein
MSWDDDDLLKTDAKRVIIDMAVHPPLPRGPEVEAMITDALAILQRAPGREAPKSPHDLVILSMPSGYAAMVDWASDPMVTLVSDAEADLLRFGDPPADDLPF